MDPHDSKTLDTLAEDVAGIRASLDKLAQALVQPTVPPDLQWVDVDGARRILSMERRQFIERIASRPDFPKAARVDGVGRPRWLASEVSTWLDRQRRARHEHD